ncbi:MAG: WS/DGAT domain-containing protein [Bacillota bacterium]
MKKYKAEIWDKMQHIMERYNDHMIHCHLEFDNQLDIPALKKAVLNALEKIPILKSRFEWNFFRARWVENESFDIDDIVKFVEVQTDPRSKSHSFFLVQKLDESKEQIKVLVLRYKNKDILNIVVNHMVMDGADIKLTMKLIADSYTDIMNGGKGDVPFKNGTRDEKQILIGFSKAEKKKVQKLISYSKKSKDKICFPFEDKTSSNNRPFIEKMIIGESDFKKAKQKLKQQLYTVNDLIVACFYRAIYNIVDIPKDKALGVPCMVDLRKYMAENESLGATNLTSMIVCNIGKDIGEDIFETIEKVKQNMDKLKSDYPGLHGLPLLRGVLNALPYGLAKLLIGSFFKNPLLGISNIGIIKENTVNFNGNIPAYLYYTGSIKYPPYYQLALTTYKNEITFTTALYGTINDRVTVKRLFEHIKKEFLEFSR